MNRWMAARLAPYQDSVFEEMNQVASRYDAVNLGSGTPEMPMAEVVREAAVRAIADGSNQYAPVRGVEALRSAIAMHAARFYGQRIDPATEVSVTSGVTEGLFAAVLALVDPGDEVIVFEPFYDCYVPAIELAGATAVPVTLHAPAFRFDPGELRAAFSARTRAIIVNSPHNPTGTVFSAAELALIAELCLRFDTLAITDEVYEHVTFDGAPHLRMATLPGMRERTLTLSGAGKTFSCTGWRIGWAIGPAPMQDALARLRQFTVFASPTPLQFAVAAGLQLPDAYFDGLGVEYQARRDLMVAALRANGLRPATPQGSFFILTDISGRGHSDGRAFCYELARRSGVVPVPTDTFYLRRHHGAQIVRFSFCQSRETLRRAAERLPQLVSTAEAAR